MRSDRRRSCGSRPASARRMATASWATVSQSTKNSRRPRVEEQEAGHVRRLRPGRRTRRRRGRGRAGWRRGCRAVRCGRRRRCPIIESRICCTVGRTRSWVGRRRGGRLVVAVRTRSNRWARSASSSCSARDDAFEDVLRHAVGVAPLEAGVVLDADPGQHRDLFAAQAFDPPVGAVHGEPGLRRA